MKIFFCACLLGNHESFPGNLFTSHNVPPKMWTSSWLYKYMASTNVWRRWLPTTDFKLLDDIEKLASYSVLAHPGFRIISFNMNYCYSLNFWNYLNMTDPDESLKWLINELQTAENNKELVHLLGHIPSGDSCTEVRK